MGARMAKLARMILKRRFSGDDARGAKARRAGRAKKATRAKLSQRILGREIAPPLNQPWFWAKPKVRVAAVMTPMTTQG